MIHYPVHIIEHQPKNRTIVSSKEIVPCNGGWVVRYTLKNLLRVGSQSYNVPFGSAKRAQAFYESI